ncbi:hypothetical protein TWF718_004515 [Orbilia javanica]|uniref:Nucleoside phosphorylase domain-containing protein n=1 Tax=Orbilia javanica TaxID=47235 RepID=A0AAN8N2U1_9PEZI
MSSNTPKSHKDYTIGWICALPKEQTAAISMLDARHPDLPKSGPSKDTNAYTLGSIGSHNVAITCLPMKCYGTNQAAKSAAHMLSTFPSIRIGFMVGIGAGVPPKVGLGDVVISTEWTQWDFGKANKDGVFEHINKRYYPPEELLSAMSKLKSEHDLWGMKIQQYLEDFRFNNPGLAAKYTTIGGEGQVGKDYAGESENPNLAAHNDLRVHYGLIASGNQVVKDAQLRDSIDDRLKNEVLCIEMEAAGLVGFPAVVLRGICDYADSIKNDLWQEYAALRAAICAKELLKCIPPSSTEIASSQDLKSVLMEVTKLKHLTEEFERKHNLAEESETNRKIANWLTTIDYRSQQGDFFNRRQPGTGEWLLNSPEYQNWLNAAKQILFCPGIPGAGKTILSSIVIDNVVDRFSLDTSVGIAYIYFNFKGSSQLQADDLFLSLLKQLTISQPSLPDCVRKVHNEYQISCKPPRKTILATLHNVIALCSRVFILVDALDECPSESILSIFLEELFNMHRTYGINIFATSRYISNIQDKFSGTGSSVRFEVRASDEDVRSFLEGQISQLGTKALKINKEMIKERISKAAQGMFLLAQLYFESIQNKPTLKKIKAALDSLPSGGRVYDTAYENIMDRIAEKCNAELNNMANQVLAWITCAARPLTTAEIQHAIALELDETEIKELEPGEYQFDPDNIPEIDDLVSLCCGLITVDVESDVVRLIHYTAQEYFERNRPFWFPQAHSDIAKICIIYLSLETFEEGPSLDREQFNERLWQNALYDYAVMNWGYHARESLAEDACSMVAETTCSGTPKSTRREISWFTKEIGLLPLIIRFLRKVNIRCSYVQAMFADKRWPWRVDRFPSDMPGLHVAAYLGLNQVIKELLMDQATDINTKSIGGIYSYYYERGRDGTPLAWALYGEREETAKMLLERGAEVNAKDECSLIALGLAAENGYEDIVKLLLERGKETNLIACNNPPAFVPLLLATSRRHRRIIRLLIDTGADINATSPFGETALILATGNILHDIDEEIVEYLINRGAYVNTLDDFNKTALINAIFRNNRQIMRLLLNNGAVIDCESQHAIGVRHLALVQAVKAEDEEIVGLLLNAGVGAKHNVCPHAQVLKAAVLQGNCGILKLLLDNGGDTEARNEGRKTLLSVALESAPGNEEIVKLLLTRGADIEAEDADGRTPLSIAREAAKKGYQDGHDHEKILKMLLEKRAEMEDAGTPSEGEAETEGTLVVDIIGGKKREATELPEGGSKKLRLEGDCSHEELASNSSC